MWDAADGRHTQVSARHKKLERGKPGTRIKLHGIRRKIAEHMVASKHVSPHVYSVDEIDMSKVAAIRAKSKEEFEKRYETKLTFMPFFVKAAVAGLRAFPTLNSSLDGTSSQAARYSQWH